MTLPPIVKSVRVQCAPQKAFRYFTEDFHKWWPGMSHSVVAFSSEFKESPASCELEPKKGGRIYEKAADGKEYHWGTILAWEPPNRLTFTWHPGTEAALAQTVEVTFLSEAEGTRVTLTHTGWEKRAEGAEDAWNSYSSGWQLILVDCFARHASQIETKN